MLVIQRRCMRVATLALLVGSRAPTLAQDRTALRIVGWGWRGAPPILTVQFDRPLRLERVTGALPVGVIVRDRSAWSASWPNPGALQLNYVGRFDPEAQTEVIIDTTFADGDGNRLGQLFREIAGPHRISVRVFRAGIGSRDTLQVRFDRAIDPPVEGRAPRGVSIEPPLPGRWDLADSTLLRFAPAGDWSWGVRYRVTVDTSFRGKHGLHVSATREWEFPEQGVQASFQPALTPTDAIQVSFNTPVAGSDRPPADALLRLHPHVAGRLEWASPQRLRFIPATGFDPRTTYEVRLDSGLTSKRGFGLDVTSPFTFRIQAELMGAPRGVVSIHNLLAFSFSQLMRPDSADTAVVGFSIDPPLPGRLSWTGPAGFRFIPDAPLVPGRMYKATIDTTFPGPTRPSLGQARVLAFQAGLQTTKQGQKSPDGRLELGFQLPLNDGRVTFADSFPGVTVTPAGPARYKIERSTMTIWPPNTVGPGQEMVVRFDTTFHSVDGTPFAAPVEIRHTVPRPWIAASWPRDPFLTPATRIRFLMSGLTDAAAFAKGATITAERGQLPTACGPRAPFRFDVIEQRPIDPRETSLGVGWNSRDSTLERLGRVVVLRPVGALPAGCTFTVAFPDSTRFRMRTPGRFEFGAVSFTADSARAPGVTRFEIPSSTPVDLHDLRRHLTIVPPAPVSVEYRQNGNDPPTAVWVDADLRPNTRYVLRIDAAVLDVFGQALQRSFELPLRTGPPRPVIQVDQAPVVVQPGTRPSIRVASTDVDAFVVCAARVPDSLRARALDRDWWAMALMPAGNTAERWCNDVSPPADVTGFANVDVPVPSGWAGPGTLVVHVLHDSLQPPERGRALVHVTDLAIHARVARSDAEVAVVRRSDGGPVAGASVRVLDCLRRFLASARTDAGGIARLRSIPNEMSGDLLAGIDTMGGRLFCGNDQWRFVAAENGDDHVETVVSWPNGDEVSPLPPAMLVPERTAYRRGDTLRVRGFVGRSSGDWLDTPTRFAITGRNPTLFAPPRILLDTAITVSSTGWFDIAVVLSDSFAAAKYSATWVVHRLGRWRELDGHDFAVYEESPPEVNMSIAASRPWAHPGDSIVFTIQTWSPDGTPAAGRRVAWRVAGRPSSGTVSSNIKRPGFDTRLAAPHVGWPHEWRAEGDVVTGVDGMARVSYRLPESVPDWPWWLGIEARVEGSAWVERTGAWVPPTDVAILFAYLRSAASGLDASTSILTIDPNGNVVPGRHVQGWLLRPRWGLGPQESLAQPTAGGAALDTIASCSVVTTVDPEPCILMADRAGDAWRVFQTEDRRGRPVVSRELLNVWERTVPAQRRAPPTVSLDREYYDAGDTAVVHMNAPATAAWVTLEDSAVVWSRLVPLRDGVADVRLPLTARQSPAARVNVSFFAPDSVGVPGKSVDLTVRDSGNVVPLRLDLIEARLTPGRTGQARLETGRAGNDDSVTITLWAINARLNAGPAMIDAERRWGQRRFVLRSSADHHHRGATPRWYQDDMTVGMVAIDQDTDRLRYNPRGDPSRSSLGWVTSPHLLRAVTVRPGASVSVPYSLPAAGTYEMVAVAVTSGGRMGVARAVVSVAQ